MDVDTHHVLQSHTYPTDLHAIGNGLRGREATTTVDRRGRKRGRTRWRSEKKETYPIICGSTLVGGSKLHENHQNQVERPKLNGLRIKMTNLQGFISLGVKN